MNAMIDWTQIVTERVDLGELAGRLAEINALVEAIEIGELLSDLPQAAEARARHAAGVGLLALLQRELAGLARDLRRASIGEGAAA